MNSAAEDFQFILNKILSPAQGPTIVIMVLNLSGFNIFSQARVKSWNPGHAIIIIIIIIRRRILIRIIIIIIKILLTILTIITRGHWYPIRDPKNSPNIFECEHAQKTCRGV